MRLFIILTCAASLASATSVWSTSAASDLSDDRDSGTIGGVTVEDTSLTPALEVAWSITDLGGGGEYQYIYTVTGPSGSGMGVSHFALEVPDSCTSGGSCVTNATVNGQSVERSLTYGADTSSNGDTNFPGDFYGVRFFPSGSTQLNTPMTVEFDSTLAPVYGDFYIKMGAGGPGNGDSAWNNASQASPNNNTSSSTQDYIAVPGDATDATPEPSSMGLLALGLIGLGLVGRRRSPWAVH